MINVLIVVYLKLYRDNYGYTYRSAHWDRCLVIVFLFAVSSFKIVKEDERAIIFRLGHLLGTKGPVLFFSLPNVEMK